MDLAQIYAHLPTHDDCIEYLEHLRWRGRPVCPYCEIANATPLAKERRYHCNVCNVAFSVTVRTVFHKTRIDLQKWFFVISHAMDKRPHRKRQSTRQIALVLGINRNTACRMYQRIHEYEDAQRDLLLPIANAVEFDLGFDHSQEQLL